MRHLLTYAVLIPAAWVSAWGFPWNLPIILVAGAFAGVWLASAEARA